MIHGTTILATAFRSEEISEIWYWIAWLGLVLSVVLAVSSLVLSFLPRGNQRLAIWNPVIGGLIALYPPLFVLHIYRIDYIAVGCDGTRASPPLISVLVWPSLPLMVCLLAIFIACVRLNRKSMA